MKLGIVGSEGAKFTLETEMKARAAIAKLIEETHADTVVSGACHLGGIDLWAIQEAHGVGAAVLEFPPKTRQWAGGYRERNIQIAEASDEVYCITVKELPPAYMGMKFGLCYHCKTNEHVKSGGCWTVNYAKKLGKKTGIIVIS